MYLETFNGEPLSRRFAILVDYLNVEKSLPRERPGERSKKMINLLKGLEREILGTPGNIIILAEVFIPSQFAGVTPKMEIAHGLYFEIICVRRMEKGAIKEVDSVDQKMINRGQFLIEHSDVTDIVIVSGDADFKDLVIQAMRHQKRVTVVSGPQAVSKRFVEMHGREEINLGIINFEAQKVDFERPI